MTCPHAETTAILAVFDEAPPEFAEHLAGCSECQAVIAEHQETVAVITPVLTAAPAPAARPRRRYWPIAAALAAAAAALLVFLPDPISETGPAPLPSLTTLDPIDNDAELLSLELELALMDLED